jgi:transcription initiation factor TFIID TATA-box-binding protein
MDDAIQEQTPEVEIANIVASGKINAELDLANVAEDLPKLHWIEEAEHSRRSGNRLLVHFPEGDTLGILAPSGVYVFTGVNSYEELEYSKNQLLSALAELGIVSESELSPKEVVDPFKVQNVVCTAELQVSDGLDLNQLAIGLGLEKTEYEPEQFPGLVYRPDNSSCTILVFASGKVVITGIKNEEIAQGELAKFKKELTPIIT